jgi:hypothetical protein
MSGDEQMHLTSDRLVSYWLRELNPDEEITVEQHLYSCGSCSEALERIVAMRDGVRALTRTGAVAAILTTAFVERLKDSGLNVREYRVESSGSVNCTIAPDDDVVVSHLSAPLSDVRRLDVLLDNQPSGFCERLTDVPFTPSGIVYAPSSEMLRGLYTATQHVRLISVEPEGERIVGEYDFHHTRHPDAL